MLNKIVDALKKRKDLSGWTVRHIVTRGTQVYAVPKGIEAKRAVEGERFVVDVLRQTKGPDGAPGLGAGDVTLLPAEGPGRVGDIEAALDQASLVAGLVSNPVHGMPGPGELPDVPLVDQDLQKNQAGVMQAVMERARAAAAKESAVKMTAAECFSELRTTHLVNSRGIDATQESTRIDLEFVLKARKGERETETFMEMTRRRVADLDIEGVIEQRARQTIDLLEAEAPASRQGPVVLRRQALAIFLAGDLGEGSVLRTLGSADAKYAKVSNWEIEKTVLRGEVKGDPLTVWANRQIPYGTSSDRFDEEGLAAQRVLLISDNELVTFSAGQRYADYLGVTPTGGFGGVELPAGVTPAKALLAEPYIEVVQFSWFNPDPITGDFATEIRLGYLVENGKRTPFKGGQLVGNVLDALADVRWSAETAFLGNYLGPEIARFNDLKLAGEDG
ncbi:MAG TPA: metallopeptidase TldD-related protein [Anaerolineales bacterium]|jgi:PmbA protein